MTGEDDDLIDLGQGQKDLIILPHQDGTLTTHGPSTCLGPHCCIHRPSLHPLRNAPLYWEQEMRMMFRVCRHEKLHPDPDSLDFHMTMALHRAPGFSFYDGWHPCCEARCCQVDWVICDHHCGRTDCTERGCQGEITGGTS